jgi:hypothetical protein
VTKNYYLTLAVAVLFCVFVQPVSAAFLLEVDVDGADDGVLTYNPRFSYGGDTTTAGQSATSLAFGTTGGDSIFGGDGLLLPDTYVYNYSPVADPDNLVVPAGTDLGLDNNNVDQGTNDIATGLTGGGAGTYKVFATWPVTTNVSGGPTRYAVNTVGDFFTVDIDQNNKGHAWILLGEIDYSGAGSITVTQQPTLSNTFVSQRAHGLLFELVPEPSGFVLLGLIGLALSHLRRKQPVN